MNFGVVVFPGSTCDRDTYFFIRDVLKKPVVDLWHKDKLPSDIDCVILPGGFSYGDYLRPGAISSKSNIMKEVAHFADTGGLVIGICNGFQILVETGLLPGALMQNQQLKFVCKTITLKVENVNTPFTKQLTKGQTLNLPIAHGDGNYYVSESECSDLEANNQILFRYSNNNGQILKDANPNGSVGNIAGIVNKNRNVLGMMPHPERAGEPLLGSQDGLGIFNSILTYWREK